MIRRKRSESRQQFPHIQPMWYQSTLTNLDATNIICRPLFLRLVHMKSRFRRWLAVGVLALLLTLAIGIYELVAIANVEYRSPWTWKCRVLAVTLTLVYGIGCGLCRQAELLRALNISFEFTFIAAQVTLVHVMLADMFQWRVLCLSLVATWQWSFWVLCVDGLTPIVRAQLGVTWWFVRLVCSAMIISLCTIVYVVCFTPYADHIQDRVFFRTWAPHQGIVEFRLVTTFFSVLLTVILFSLRTWWRIWHGTGNELVIIDGPVVYINYLRQQTAKLPSRRNSIASILPTA